MTEFTVFPKLPTEIRRKVFKHALPAQDVLQTDRSGLIIVKLHRVSTSTENGSSYFSYQIDKQQFKHKEWLVARGLNLLEACQESRAVFLENFKYFLPTSNAKIYFNDETKIYVTNYLQMASTKSTHIPPPTDLTRAKQEISDKWESMKRHVLKVWDQNYSFVGGQNYPTDLIGLPAGFVVEGLPALRSQRIQFLIDFSRVAFVASICVGSKKYFKAFEEALRSQAALGRRYELQNTFYIGLREEDESAEEVVSMVGSVHMDDNDAAEENKAQIAAVEDVDVVEGDTAAMKTN